MALIDSQLLQQILPANVHPTDVTSISGGCISDAYRVAYKDVGDRTRNIFIKQNSLDFHENFYAEYDGLKALREAGMIRIPEPIGVFTSNHHAAFAMQWIEPGRQSDRYFAEFGRSLARLHLATRTDDHQHGWPNNNFLGASPQLNRACDSWFEFVAEHRLRFQIRSAAQTLDLDTTLKRDVERIADRIDELLVGRNPIASLLHGDLWSGNYLCDETGKVVLIDPAVYRGCPEAEFGMIKLFGSCPGEFYEAYFEVNPFPDGWQRRVRIYVLYHLLNHLNLFGVGYTDQCRSVAATILLAD